MLAGLSTRRYPVGLEPVGARVEQAAVSTSKSAVSRRFVTATETALAELWAAEVSGLDLVALMVDGVHFGEHCCVVALGIDVDGVKHPLSLVEGSTENATLVRELLVGLRERGLNIHPPPPGGDRRGHGSAAGCARRVRPPGDRPVSAALCRPPDYADVGTEGAGGGGERAGEVGIIRGFRAR
jgi:Transposase, Mutator family